MVDVMDKFNRSNAIDAYSRADNVHPLDIYLGKDAMSRYAFLILSEDTPKSIISSKMVSVEIAQRTDKKWVLSFSLSNDDYIGIFVQFCSDLIESSREISGDSPMKFVCDRYIMWQQMLTKTSGDILSINSIKGLIGELLVLLDFLSPRIGLEGAFAAWVGPDGADQDFIIGSNWYEVKTTVSGANNIHISSVEQLDCDKYGELLLVYLDKSSSMDAGSISLNQIVERLYDLLTNTSQKDILRRKLILLGYIPQKEYDQFTFSFKKMDRYAVCNTFPCMRKATLPISVFKVQYELSVSSISQYRIEDNNGTI